jgi:hypothetical protein
VREVAIAMARDDRCSCRVEAARAKEHAAPARGIGVQRVEAVPVPAQAKGGSHRQSLSCQKTVGSETFLPSAVVQRSCKILVNPRCHG